MKINSNELLALMLQLAMKNFANRTFHRRDLMELVENEVKAQGQWTPEDDRISGSAGLKTMGMADIDYRFSDLAHRAFVPAGKRGFWRIAPG